MNTIPLQRKNIKVPPPYSAADYNVFDTLSLNHIYPPSKAINYRKIFKYNGFVWKPKSPVKRINVTYRFSGSGFQIVTATFSILELLYGDNLFAEIDESDIANALNIVSKEVSALVGFDFDAPSGKMTKIDGNRDFSTVEKHEYLAALENHRIPRTKFIRYPKDSPLLPATGYEFNNQGRRIKIYDKFAHLNEKHPELPEYKRNFAETFLRVEIRLLKYALRRYVYDFFESKDRTASKVLKPEFAAYIVERTLTELGLTTDIPTFDQYRQTLLEIFPAKQAYGLIRFSELIYQKGIKGAKKEYGHNFKSRKKKLTDAGIWRDFFAKKSALPAFSKQPNDDWRMYYDDDEYFY